MTIDELTRRTTGRPCARIYEEGLDMGTFEETVPSWEAVGRRATSRRRGWSRATRRSVLGWAALAPSRDAPCYRGVVENSVYVGAAARGRGVGRALLEELVRRADERRHLDDPGATSLAATRRVGRAATQACGVPDRRASRETAGAEATASGATSALLERRSAVRSDTRLGVVA